jgi:hypothetical protein
MRNLENLTIHQFRGLRDFSLQSLGQINLLAKIYPPLSKERQLVNLINLEE